MSDVFDPYLDWLGIPPSEQPPNHYRLLGLHPFEESREAIQTAVKSQTAWLEALRLGYHGAHAARLLSKVANAGACLVDPESKAAYDKRLREKLASTARKGSAGAKWPSGSLGWADPAARTRWLAAGVLGTAQLMGVASFWLVVLLLIRQGEPSKNASSALASQDIRGGDQDAGASRQATPPEKDPGTGDEEETLPIPPRPGGAMRAPPPKPGSPPLFGARKDTASSIAAPTLAGAGSGVPSGPGAATASAGLPKTRPDSREIADRNAPHDPRRPDPNDSMGQSKGSPGRNPSGRSSGRTDDSIDLGSGKLLQLRDFAVPRYTIEQARTYGIRVQHEDEFDEAYLGSDQERRLNGPAVAYREGQFKLVANYYGGERHGIAVLWIGEGQDWYWARYVGGRRDGNCCLFEAGEPTAICECASGRLVTLYLIADRKARKSFPGLDAALEDEEARLVLSDLSDAESEMEEIEDVFVEEIHSHFQKEAKKTRTPSQGQATGRTAARPPQAKKSKATASEATRAARERMSSRINQRGAAQRSGTIDGIRRAWGR